MGKQGTITSFFRPKGDSGQNSLKAKPSKSLPKKRPRLSNPSKPSDVRPNTATSEKEVPKSSKRPRHDEPSQEQHESDRDTPSNPETKPVSPSRNKRSAAKVAEPESSDLSGDEKTTKCSRAETGSIADSISLEKKSVPKSMFHDDKLDRTPTGHSWKKGNPVPYKFLAEAFTKVEELSGRLEIQAILTDVLRKIIILTPEDLVPAIYLCVNKLAPAHEGIELGMGEAVLLKSLSQVTGRSTAALKSTYKELGDLGDVASASRTTQKTMFPPPPLTVRRVFSEFRAIAAISGKSTQEAKRARVVKMLVAASKEEAKFIVRALLGKLRINLADKTIIVSLAAAVIMENENVKSDALLSSNGKKKTKLSRKEEEIEELVKDASATLNRVYSQLPVWDSIIPKLLKFRAIDERLVKSCKLVPGVPVSPMLAKPTKAISEVLERFTESSFTCEYKYDGERAQVHRLKDGKMKIYSRNAEDLTPKYPDLLLQIPKALSENYKDASFIIDGEAVAYDTEKKQILPFQELQSRKRKDVSAANVTVKVCIFAFDLIYFNGESLLEETLEDRRKHLQKGFMEQEGQFMFAIGHDSRDPEQIMDLLNASIKEGCEGLMVKALTGINSTYEPANRSQNWLKVKKDYLEGCGDSLDLVPIGGYLGRGKRTGTFGAFLLACYDPDNEEYQSVCKIGTGFSEADLENFAEFFNDSSEERKCDQAKSYYNVPGLKTLEPDVWFEPVQVWEVKCADLSLSPQHKAAIGKVDQEKGIALRFPRFLRIRDDKKPEEATSAEQVAEMYMNQSAVANNS